MPSSQLVLQMAKKGMVSLMLNGQIMVTLMILMLCYLKTGGNLSNQWGMELSMSKGLMAKMVALKILMLCYLKTGGNLRNQWAMELPVSKGMELIPEVAEVVNGMTQKINLPMIKKRPKEITIQQIQMPLSQLVLQMVKRVMVLSMLKGQMVILMILIICYLKTGGNLSNQWATEL